MSHMSMNKILEASFGETSSKLRASYKKTVQIRPYETEVMEVETELNIENGISGAERMLISAILQAQLEYECFCNLVYKGIVTSAELDKRRRELEDGVTAIKDKAEKLLGKPLDKYFNYLDQENK